LKDVLTDFSCENCEELIKTKEQADNLQNNAEDFATMKIDNKEYILITEEQLKCVEKKLKRWGKR